MIRLTPRGGMIDRIEVDLGSVSDAERAALLEDLKSHDARFLLVNVTTARRDFDVDNSTGYIVTATIELARILPGGNDPRYGGST